MMRLSEAVELGSVALLPCAGGGDGVTTGCALTRAMKAVGAMDRYTNRSCCAWQYSAMEWNWLSRIVTVRLHGYAQWYRISVREMIALVWDFHFNTNTLDLNAFLDWLRELEAKYDPEVKAARLAAQEEKKRMVKV